MLDAAIAAQLKSYLGNLKRPIELIASLDDGAKSRELCELLQEEAYVIDQIKALQGPFEFETYISLSCQNCPEVVQALNVLSVFNPNISTP